MTSSENGSLPFTGVGVMPRLCPEMAKVDAHFAATISATEERSLRDHLATCGPCRRRYERQALLATLDPDALSAEDRIGRALGVGVVTTARPAGVLRALPLAVSALALAASLLLLLRPPNRPSEDALSGDGFRPRGSIAPPATSPSPLVVFRVRPGSSDLVRTGDGAVAANEELAFAYENVDHLPYLMIFGVDAQPDRSRSGKVYWFFPAWTDARETPVAIAADPSPGVHELGEAVRHPFTSDRVELHALFLSTPLDVRTVEDAIARQGPENQAGRGLAIAGAVDHVITMEVRR